MLWYIQHSQRQKLQAPSLCDLGLPSRDEQGEELTLDYKAETESEKEPRHAICLCGASHCRGSFLYHTNTANTPQQQVHTAQPHASNQTSRSLYKPGVVFLL